MNYRRSLLGVRHGLPYRVTLNRMCDEGKGDTRVWRWFLWVEGKYIGDFERKRDALRAMSKLHRTVTITRVRKYRLASDLDCDVSEIDELIASGVLDTPGITFQEAIA